MKRNTGIIIFLTFIILIGLYFVGGFYYKDKFPRKVYVNDVNIGGLTLEKADAELGKTDVWDKIIIKSDTEEFLEIEADEIEYKYIGSPGLGKIFDEEKEENWISSIFKESVYTTEILSDYNEGKAKNMIDAIEELDKKLLNASIVYSDSSGAFVIEPHSYEIKITKEELFDLVDKGIRSRDTQVDLEEYIEQPSIFLDNQELISSKEKANEYLDLKIKYDFGDREELVDGSIIKNFITFSGTDLIIDPEKVKEYVGDLGRKYDTFGRNRSFRTSTGKDITTNGGSYGWMIHRGKTADALIEHIKNDENKTIEPVYSYKAVSRSSNDIGNSYVEIDLKEQMVYVYVNGALKIKTETVTGNVARGHATPTGVFPINYKETNAVLRGENYASPVKYWMPFNMNIGMHDADWRDKFGGDIYKNSGSNGCINLPPENTKTIFDSVYPGMPVIVH